MLVLLSAVNAKFIHSSPALHSLAAYSNAYKPKEKILIREFTINHRHEYIVSEIFKLAPDVLCFSCYIWSIEPIKRICRTIKKILPKTSIVLGGPEVSFDYDNLLEDRICDIIAIGEGEQTFVEILSQLDSYIVDLRNIAGIAFYENGVVRNKKRKSLDLNSIPFPYSGTLEDFKNRIVYYETSRGCPFSCKYCMSSLESGVRYLSLERVFKELNFFIENKTPLVKFTDRTFNCDSKRAAAIWRFLQENDNGSSRFHFEIAADLLTDEIFDILKESRKDLFQFEIGIQSTNLNTLNIINRKSDLSSLFDAVEKLKKFANINLHLDLIAGLPGENFQSFRKSFNQAYGLNPDMLQVGFLKLLKGLPLRNGYGILYDDSPPYRVLGTKDMSFAELHLLSGVEELVDLYYNSRKAYCTLNFCIREFDSAFDFYYKFSCYWTENHLYDVSHSSINLYKILYDFLQASLMRSEITSLHFITDLITFDMCRAENTKKFPDFAEENSDKNVVRELYVKHVPKEKQRMYYIRAFEYDVIKWLSSGFKDIEHSKTYVLFDYINRSAEKLEVTL